MDTGLLFGQFLVAASRNPEEFEKLYGTCLTAFALIETFSFLAIVVAI
jgi:F0F1-type ATP synthase membrane subunit c/vacuolar-type H+-ATPase subunit K